MFNLLRLATLMTGVALASMPARADPMSVSTFDFSGICSDCATVGNAELTLSNYTLGDAISAANFVSFAYAGTDLLPAFNIDATQAYSLAGSIGAPIPGPQDFTVSGNGEDFTSQTYGFWCAGQACFDDLGFTHSWTVASVVVGASPVSMPEPTSLVIFAIGVLGVIALRRV